MGLTLAPGLLSLLLSLRYLMLGIWVSVAIVLVGFFHFFIVILF
jgi:hypothetical protein